MSLRPVYISERVQALFERWNPKLANMQALPIIEPRESVGEHVMLRDPFAFDWDMRVSRPNSEYDRRHNASRRYVMLRAAYHARQWR